MNYQDDRVQQLAKLKIPKVLFLPNEFSVKERQLQKSPPQTPMKGSMTQTDMHEKLKVLKAEREARQHQYEQELEDKAKRSMINRQAVIMNRLNVVDQQIAKWKKIRNNIELYAQQLNLSINKAKMQYIFDYYENILNRNSSHDQRSTVGKWDKFSSLQEFANKKTSESVDKNLIQIKQKQRIQAVFDQQYKQKIDQIDLNLRLQRKKQRMKTKQFTLKKQFYNVDDFKYHSYFVNQLS